MNGLSGDQIAATLLKALPADAAEQLLGRLGADAAQRLRATLQASAGPPPEADLDSALSEFFDLFRIAERGLLPQPPAAQFVPVTLTPVEPPVEDPLVAVKSLPTDKLIRALEGEPPAAIAMLLGTLDAETAGAVLKGLSTDVRADVAMRYSQPGQRNHAVLTRLARAVADKGRALPDVPPPLPAETRLSDLAMMLRGLPRAERIAVLAKVELTDPDLAANVRGKLYKMTDLLKVEDRQLQGLLAQVDMKSLACALKGADPAVSAKLSSNISSRARDLLQEELGLLGNISKQQVETAQAEMMYLFRQFEEEGKIVIEE